MQDARFIRRYGHVQNPYAKRLKTGNVAMNEEIIDYFGRWQRQWDSIPESGSISFQDCVNNHRKPQMRDPGVNH